MITLIIMIFTYNFAIVLKNRDESNFMGKNHIIAIFNKSQKKKKIIFSYSCGQNSCGELATKRKGDRVILTPLKDYVFKQIRSIGSGYEFSVVVDKNGKIKGYGKASGLKLNKTVKKSCFWVYRNCFSHCRR
eukprot:Anaeramoba_flamelloidesa588581_17.p1 GENE.a588581_17~~a588581_17.p1  ORF type:complete len:132 (-),score=13.17 a588581_17:191-586(-)